MAVEAGEPGLAADLITRVVDLVLVQLGIEPRQPDEKFRFGRVNFEFGRVNFETMGRTASAASRVPPHLPEFQR